MDGFTTSRFRLVAIVAIAILSLGMAGCGGSDGDRGASGTDGTDGGDGLACWDLNGNGVPDFPDEDTNGDGVIDVFDCRTPPITSGIDISNDLSFLLIDEFVAVIDSVTVGSDGHPVVDFTLTDGLGTPILGLTEVGAVRGAFAKLEPAANGLPSQWQSYMNRIETANGNTPDVLDQAVQGTNDSGGTLVAGEAGKYRYTYATDVTKVTDPIVVLYEPTLTHQVALEVRIEDPNTGEDMDPPNPWVDFVPDGGAVSTTKLIASTALCNDCHQDLALHGGHRNQTEYCVTCHNPGTIDQDTADSVDMAYMIHSIHTGEERAELGFPYIIYGFRDAEHDYSHVVFPQDVRNCANCHSDSADTPDGDAWKTSVGASQCGGCHIEGLNIVARDSLTGEPTYSYIHTALGGFESPNGQCVTCHLEGGPAGATDEFHFLVADAAAEFFQYNVLGATATAPGEFPVVTFSITDPQNGDAPYDIFAAGGPWDTAMWGGSTRLAVDLAWASEDYYNVDSGSEQTSPIPPGSPANRPGTPAQVVSINPLSAGVATDNGDGTYTVTSTVAVPAIVEGTLAVAIEGHPAVDPDGDGAAVSVPVTGAVEFFSITDVIPLERRQIVDIDQCNSCHAKLSLHGSNRTDNIDLCVVCHNSNATDIRARQEAIEGTFGNSLQPGDKSEETVDFKRMIHQIHDANVVIYGFGGSRHDYTHVEYPTDINDCTVCHIGETFYPTRDDRQFRWSTTYISDNFDNVDDPSLVVPTVGRTPERAATLANQEDDFNITPNAAVCTSCHTSDKVKAHVEQQGGNFAAKQNLDGSLNPATFETCVLCHGPGKIADVAVMHELD